MNCISDFLFLLWCLVQRRVSGCYSYISVPGGGASQPQGSTTGDEKPIVIQNDDMETDQKVVDRPSASHNDTYSQIITQLPQIEVILVLKIAKYLSNLSCWFLTLCNMLNELMHDMTLYNNLLI
ncbi:hypothetical protein L2E82_30728 [Cichorium intybus]|uniref:Uncharacterized protein n=1 Tax=Cichorium intybus TaxID=13427 RepID=A0ACB9D1I3_CICIN|nr:hypothetical protein L2E82_30728 [Cichorium intybus]